MTKPSEWEAVFTSIRVHHFGSKRRIVFGVSWRMLYSFSDDRGKSRAHQPTKNHTETGAPSLRRDCPIHRWPSSLRPKSKQILPDGVVDGPEPKRRFGHRDVLGSRQGRARTRDRASTPYADLQHSTRSHIQQIFV